MLKVKLFGYYCLHPRSHRVRLTPFLPLRARRDIGIYTFVYSRDQTGSISFGQFREG